MNGPIFNGGEGFQQLWSELPKIITYQDYIDMCNEIDSAQMDRLITGRDEHILLGALEIVKKHKKSVAPKTIKRGEAEHE